MIRPPVIMVLLGLGSFLVSSPAAEAAPSDDLGETANIPFVPASKQTTVDALVRTLTLRDYNTRLVVGGTTLLGLAAGVIGTFAYLRRRSMLGDALSHATLPGIVLAFLIVQQKWLPALLAGAAISSVLGVLCVLGMRAIPRIKEDAAIGIVLSVFFGAGMVLLSVVQQSSGGHQAGLSSFIYGKAAAMLKQDALLIAASAAAVLVGGALLFKEFRLICFDTSYAAAQGWPVWLIDLAMMGLLVTTVVIGLQAVGLILVIALLVIPAATARFWTDRLVVMVVLAGFFGAVSGWLGSTISALAPRMPTGAVIVLCAGVLFSVSLLFSPHRGLIADLWRRARLARRVTLQHLLRALAEGEEAEGAGAVLPVDRLLRQRSWSARHMNRIVARAVRSGFVSRSTDGVRLTKMGRGEARRVLRNHRLWELYLIHYARVAPSHVDRDADEIEHVLPESIVQELQAALERPADIPPSPHPQEMVP